MRQDGKGTCERESGREIETRVRKWNELTGVCATWMELLGLVDGGQVDSTRLDGEQVDEAGEVLGCDAPGALDPACSG